MANVALRVLAKSVNSKQNHVLSKVMYFLNCIAHNYSSNMLFSPYIFYQNLAYLNRAVVPYLLPYPFLGLL